MDVLGKTYENSLWYVHKLFSACFNKHSRITYKNNLQLIQKQFNPIFLWKQLTHKIILYDKQLFSKPLIKALFE